MSNKSVLWLRGEVKSVEDESPAGSFEVVASTPSLDRDGEIIDAGAFAPLPGSIPVHVDHSLSVLSVVGKGVPRYDGQNLIVTGSFDADATSQVVREKVKSGSVGSVSVGFIAAKRELRDGVRHIVAAELIEVSFVSVPCNPDAAVRGAKSNTDSESKSVAGSYEARRDILQDALRVAYQSWCYVVATFDDRVVFESWDSTVEQNVTRQVPYEIGSDGAIALGEAETVTISEVVIPVDGSPGDGAAKAASSLAPESTRASATALLAQAALALH